MLNFPRIVKCTEYKVIENYETSYYHVSVVWHKGYDDKNMWWEWVGDLKTCKQSGLMSSSLINKFWQVINPNENS